MRVMLGTILFLAIKAASSFVVAPEFPSVTMNWNSIALMPRHNYSNCDGNTPSYEFYYPCIDYMQYSGVCAATHLCEQTYVLKASPPDYSSSVSIDSGKSVTWIKEEPTGVWWNQSCTENSQCPSSNHSPTGTSFTPYYEFCE
jgi:hypothetical protein